MPCGNWAPTRRARAGSGCPPVVVRAAGLPGGRAEVAGNISSQFLSAVLQAAPCAASDVVLSVRGELVSKPYVAMTLAVMRAFGVRDVLRRLSPARAGAAVVSWPHLRDRT